MPTEENEHPDNMTDAEFKSQKARLKRLSDKWTQGLGLDNWHLTFGYTRTPLPLGDAIDDNGREFCPAKTSAHWQYQRAFIEWGMLDIADYDDEDLERVFIHELVHVLVNEMREWGMDEMPTEKVNDAVRHEERVVTQLANALLWVRRAGFDAGRKVKQKKR